MSDKYYKHVETVAKALSECGIETQIKSFPAGTRTSEDAAKSIGCSLNQVAKSLIFKTKKTHEPVLVLASGSNKVNEKIIAHELGEKIEKADAKFTKEVTGFTIGGIPPCGHKTPIKHIFIDKDLITLSKIWSAAGSPNTVFNLTPDELIKLTGAKVISIKK